MVKEYLEMLLYELKILGFFTLLFAPAITAISLSIYISNWYMLILLSYIFIAPICAITILNLFESKNNEKV